MASDKKVTIVNQLNTALSQTKTLVLTNHTGLTHQQLEKLRKNVKKSGGNFLVVKNTLFKRALSGTKFADKISDANLTGPTSLLLSIDDEITPLKELMKLVKETSLPKLKQGALTDRILTEQEVRQLADLPTKDILLSQLIGMLKFPQTRLVFALKGNLIKLALVLKAISKKKEVS